MSDANLDLERRIRERAYFLWEAEGRPEGRSMEFWDRARALEPGAAPAPGHRGPGPVETASIPPGGERSRGHLGSAHPARGRAIPALRTGPPGSAQRAHPPRQREPRRSSPLLALAVLVVGMAWVARGLRARQDDRHPGGYGIRRGWR